LPHERVLPGRVLPGRVLPGRVLPRRLLIGATALLSLGLLAGCGGSSSGSASGTDPVTLNVWLMQDSAPQTVVDQVNAAFKSEHPNVTVKTQTLEWDGRDVKWKTALPSSTPPDVLEMGNTDVLAYAASGGLADLTGKTFENQSTWLQGLKDAGSYDGKLYGVPYYGGDRVVIYRKDLWKKAGLTGTPTTLAELKADGVKLQASGGKDFSGLYFPGRYQYAALPFVYDAGGSIASRSGDKWTANLSSPQSLTGLNAWADFVRSVSRAPADTDETNISDVLGKGHTGMIIGQAWMVGGLQKDYPALAKQFGAFAMPGTAGPMPVFLGGSNLAASAAGKHQDLAYDWIKLMTGTTAQTALETNGLLPNTTALASAATGITAVQLQAAAHSWFTPTSTKWSDVDNDKVIMDMFQSIASGHASVADAAKKADQSINQVLNAD
jgi:N,N'-diacetylchitobiose transport system substrate-binding protein